MALHHQPSFRPAASFLHDEPCGIPRKGLEAPRNSLEMEEPAVTESDSSSSTARRKEPENLNIPVNIQIKTTRDNKSPRTSLTKPEYMYSDSCSSNSPAAPGGGDKTPTLVARLMGLDQLPPQLRQTSTTPPAYGAAFNPKRSSGLHHLGQSRSISHRSFYDNDVLAGSGGTVSLPETPRISSASSRRSDVDHGHRLSLQINKENINSGEDFEISAARRRRELLNYKRADEDLLKRRGSDYAKEIVKQIKESVVRRKVGLSDITNTVKSRDQKVSRRDDDYDDDHVVLLKPNKPSKVSVTKKVGYESVGPSKQSTPSCSPRLLDIINEPESAKNPTNSHYSWSPSPENQQPPSGNAHFTPNSQPLKLRDPEQKSPAVIKKPKRDDKDKSGSGIRRTPQVVDPIMKKKEEPFIRPTTAQRGNNMTDKKCKKTPISNDIFNISVPNLLPVKNQALSSDGEAKWKSSPQLPSGSSQGYRHRKQHQQVTHTPNFQENNQDRNYRTITSSTSTLTNVASSSAGDQEVVEIEYRYYIRRILKRAGVDESTPVSLAKWYSQSHPLDPSIFHYIELFHPTVAKMTMSPAGKKDSELNLRCNRKLVFQLVDELLADILKPYLGGTGSRCRPRDQMYGSELIDVLCSRIKKFPRADCKVLEDIDALIDTDLGNAAASSSSAWVHANYDEEEREKLVEEIQRHIMKSLMYDTEMATRAVQVF